MDDSSRMALSQLALSPPLAIALLVLICASVAAGLVIVLRLRRGLPVLPYERRCQVPWRAVDVLLVFVVLELPLLIGLLLGPLLGSDIAQPAGTPTAENVDVQHPIVDLLSAEPSPATWLLCVLAAVVVAPIVEEFIYRLLLQGWVEAEERGARRRVPELRRLIPGVGPVVLVSLLFALRHFRTASPPMKPDLIKQAMVFQVVWSLLAFGFAVVLLRIRSGATAADLGFVGKKFLADVRLGLLAFAVIGAPILAIQYLMTMYVLPVLPWGVAADPIPLFFLALALGTVYYRTHRLTPAIVIHMALNATSLALAWLQL